MATFYISWCKLAKTIQGRMGITNCQIKMQEVYLCMRSWSVRQRPNKRYYHCNSSSLYQDVETALVLSLASPCFFIFQHLLFGTENSITHSRPPRQTPAFYNRDGQLWSTRHSEPAIPLTFYHSTCGCSSPDPSLFPLLARAGQSGHPAGSWRATVAHAGYTTMQIYKAHSKIRAKNANL